MNFSFSLPNQATLISASAESQIVLDFSAGALPPGVTLTRSSPALGFSTPTTAEISAVDMPRFGVDPKSPQALSLLVEASATNILPYARPTQASWTSTATTVTDIASPTFGYFSGVTIASTGYDWGRAGMSVSVVSGITYCVSAYVKSGTSGRLRILFRNGAASSESRIYGAFGALANTDSAGTITSVEDHLLPDGITHLIQFRFTPNFTGSAAFGIGPDSTVSGQTVQFLAGQIEPATSFSSLIDTGSAGQTRAADVLSISGISGTFDVTATFADGSQTIYPSQAVTYGYWPTGLTGFVQALAFA